MNLDRSEREVVLTIADDEVWWTVFTDSRRLGSRLLEIAARCGVTPEPKGAGYEFRLPLEAVRFVGPRRVTEIQRAARRESMRKARLSRRTPTENPGTRTSRLRIH